MPDSSAAQPPHEPAHGYRPPIRLVEADEEEFDALTDLFLGEDDAQATRGSSRPAQPPATAPMASDCTSRGVRGDSMIEALILGHLPVSAAAWVKSYAVLRARALGSPVGLLRMHGGAAVVEMIDPTAPSRRFDTLESFDEAIRVAQRLTRHWILRVDDPVEPELRLLPSLDALTVLSGADEAAVVATYRALKGLALDETAPAVNVAIMGSGEADSRHAWERIERASAAFLPAPPRLAGTMSHAAALPAGLLYRGPAPASLADTLDRLRSGFRSAESDRDAGGGDPTPAADVLAPPVDVPPGSGNGIAAPSMEPSVPPGTSPAATSDMHEIGEICPDAPDVAFALDESGRLHLTAAHGPAATEMLLAAQAWAQRHASLLSRAYPQLTPGSVVLHLIAERASDVTHLIQTSIRLKLKTSASVDGRTIPVIVDLT